MGTVTPHLYRLENRHGHAVSFLDLGGIVTSIEMPDRYGQRANVVLGYADVADYAQNPAFLGALVGRFANRIAGARFVLAGRTYLLDANEGPNTLHGGSKNFSSAVWRVERLGPAAARLALTSQHGESGFPGRLDVAVTYSLDDADCFCIGYEARSDAPTPVNLTSHSYFNLEGNDAPSALDHTLTLAAEAYLPVDAALLPRGNMAPVADTLMDFRAPARIGARRGGGYDHCYVRALHPSAKPRFAARLVAERSGRVLEVYTTEPGLQLYTGAQLPPPFRKGQGICLETQHFPDSPNRPDFPPVILRPGEVFRSATEFCFGTQG